MCLLCIQHGPKRRGETDYDSPVTSPKHLQRSNDIYGHATWNNPICARSDWKLTRRPPQPIPIEPPHGSPPPLTGSRGPWLQICDNYTRMSSSDVNASDLKIIAVTSSKDARLQMAKVARLTQLSGLKILGKTNVRLHIHHLSGPGTAATPVPDFRFDRNPSQLDNVIVPWLARTSATLRYTPRCK